jgi:hypothetical protein
MGIFSELTGDFRRIQADWTWRVKERRDRLVRSPKRRSDA